MTVDPNALRALADRVEEAAEGDRRLDLDILAAIGAPSEIDGWCPPRFTFSADAALALVPEGHRWAIKQKEDFYAGCWREIDGVGPSVIGDTPALALTAACLRAHAAIVDPSHDR